MVRALASHARGHKFKSCTAHFEAKNRLSSVKTGEPASPTTALDLIENPFSHQPHKLFIGHTQELSTDKCIVLA